MVPPVPRKRWPGGFPGRAPGTGFGGKKAGGGTRCPPPGPSWARHVVRCAGQPAAAGGRKRPPVDPGARLGRRSGPEPRPPLAAPSGNRRALGHPRSLRVVPLLAVGCGRAATAKTSSGAVPRAVAAAVGCRVTKSLSASAGRVFKYTPVGRRERALGRFDNPALQPPIAGRCTVHRCNRLEARSGGHIKAALT